MKQSLLECSYKLLNMISDRKSEKKIKTYLESISIIFETNSNPYFNANTKWIYSLVIVSIYLNDPHYLYLASHYLLTFHPIKEYKTDCLDEFVIMITLLLNLSKFKHEEKGKEYIFSIKKILSKSVIDVYNYKLRDTKTLDLLELGFVLINSYKIRMIIFHYNCIKDIIDKSVLFKLYENLLNRSSDLLFMIKFDDYSIKENAYEWMTIIIGINTIKNLHYLYKNKKINDRFNIKLLKFIRYYPLKNRIKKNITSISYLKGNWTYLDNELLKNIDYPLLYLV